MCLKYAYETCLKYRDILLIFFSVMLAGIIILVHGYILLSLLPRLQDLATGRGNMACLQFSGFLSQEFFFRIFSNWGAICGLILVIAASMVPVFGGAAAQIRHGRWGEFPYRGNARPSRVLPFLNKVFANLIGKYVIYLLFLSVIALIFLWFLFYYEIPIVHYQIEHNGDLTKIIRDFRGHIISNPLFSVSLTVFFAIIADVAVVGRDPLFEKKKLKDLQRMIDRQKAPDRRIIIGFNETGREALREMILGMRNKQTRILLWERARLFLPDVLVVAAYDEKVPFVVGKHPIIGNIGYTKCMDAEEGITYYIPIFIGHADSPDIQTMLGFKDARTITSCVLGFDFNLSILDLPVEQRLANENWEANKVSYIIPCRDHTERELLEDKLNIGPHADSGSRPMAEVFNVSESFGFAIADIINTKIHRDNQNGGRKILFCGDLNLRYVIEGLILNKAISPETDRSNNIFCNAILLFDVKSTPSEEIRFQTAADLKSHPAGKHIYDEFFRFFDELDRPLKKRVQLMSLILAHPKIDLEQGRYHFFIPVVDERSMEFLIDVLASWKPDLLVVGYESSGDCLKCLKTLERSMRWPDASASLGRPEKMPSLVVAVSKPTTQLMVINMLKENFSTDYGVYAPYNRIGRELAIHERMLYNS